MESCFLILVLKPPMNDHMKAKEPDDGSSLVSAISRIHNRRFLIPHECGKRMCMSETWIVLLRFSDASEKMILQMRIINPGSKSLRRAGESKLSSPDTKIHIHE
jgi:hypothetical protein